jgi:signal transduction histidine kinase
MVHRLIGEDIELRLIPATDLWTIHVDPGQMEQVLVNLCVNARDAMPDGGTLRITLENRLTGEGSPRELPSGAYIVVSISDTGIGMDEATLARAFDPFFTTKEIGSGSGLGLPMVQRFAAQSGGAVRILSKPGAGTTVELWLPATDETPVVGERS